MANGDKTYTKGGHTRAPTKQQVCEWVNESWKLLSKNIIKESFRTCGISVSVTGVEDDDVGCMKEGREAAGAKSLVLKETQDLLNCNEEDEDPFADLDDEDPEDDYTQADIAAEVENDKSEAHDVLEVFEGSSEEEDS